jgi:hypothetical protein
MSPSTKPRAGTYRGTREMRPPSSHEPRLLLRKFGVAVPGSQQGPPPRVSLIDPCTHWCNLAAHVTGPCES